MIHSSILTRKSQARALPVTSTAASASAAAALSILPNGLAPDFDVFLSSGLAGKTKMWALAQHTRHVDHLLHDAALVRDEGHTRPLQSGNPKRSMVERVRTEVQANDLDGDGPDMPLEFGRWSAGAACSTYDGVPSVTALENKSMDKVPTARSGIGMPEGGKAQWTFRLDAVKGLVSIGVVAEHVPLGVPFRKAEHKGHAWHYTSDGVLRDGARSVGRKGPEASTGDVVTMRLGGGKLFFLINDVPFADPIENVTGHPLFVSLQVHRKGDFVSLTSQRFDDRTLQHIKNLSWGMVTVVGDGPMAGHTAVALTSQRSQATACHKAPDNFGTVVPSVRSASAVEEGESAEWTLKIQSCRAAIYIGLEQVSWKHGHDWWCEEAVDRVWYYSGEGSLRSGNTILQRSTVTFLELQATDPDSPRSASNKTSECHRQPIYKPFIPALCTGDILTATLADKTLSFVINDKHVEGEIRGVHGKVRLAVQFEHDGDTVAILPR